MRIVGAEFFNFRNLEPGHLVLWDRINMFLGENGQGKSNLLEALNYMALGRSHRSARNDDLIRFGASHLHVKLSVTEDGDALRNLSFAIERGGARRLRVDDEIVPRRADLIGVLPTVFFSPESIGLVRAGPEMRRRYVDQGLSGIDAAHLSHLQFFRRGLRQKNHLLRETKRGRVDRAEARREMAAWNRELAQHAAAICQGRTEYVDLVGPFASIIYNDIAQQDGPLEFRYRPRLKAAREKLSGANLEREIFREFDYIGEDEFRYGRPLTGPQLDDFSVRLAGRELRVFGSQGETRTAAISLILAQSDVVFQRRGVRPVLFFDDIFSELDRKRSRRLQETSIREHQIFIATARQEDVAGWQPDGLRVWEVAAGKLGALA